MSDMIERCLTCKCQITYVVAFPEIDGPEICKMTCKCGEPNVSKNSRLDNLQKKKDETDLYRTELKIIRYKLREILSSLDDIL